MNKYVPVIEFEDFIKETSNIDQIFHLQNYIEGWSNGNFEEKFDFRPCNDKETYFIDGDNKYYGYFWGYEKSIHASNFTCVSYQGMTGVMAKLIQKYSNLK